MSMFKGLKRYFIPNEENDYKPHFLCSKNTRLLLLTVLVIELGVLMLPRIIVTLDPAKNDFLAAVLPSVLDDLTNENRQSQNLSVLTENALLDKVAELRAQDMAQKGYFSHLSPDGKAPWYWFNQVGYKYEYAGENIAVDFTDSEDVTMAWMNSPSHRANILKNTYTEIGTGIATGVYQGRSTVFVAQVFGKPLRSSVTHAAVSTTTPSGEPAFAGTTPSKVLGTSTEAIASSTAPVAANSAVSSPANGDTVNVDIVIKYILSPRHIADIVLVTLGALVLLALALKLFIRVDKQHPAFVTSGFIILTIIFGAYVVNNYVADSKVARSTSFAGFHGEKFDGTN